MAENCSPIVCVLIFSVRLYELVVVAVSLSLVSGVCVPTVSPSWPDGVDNDCDGRVDEEICSPSLGRGISLPTDSVPYTLATV